MADELPPMVRHFVIGLGRIGYRAISAAVATVAREVSTLTEEAHKRVKHASEAAEKMARGEPYEPRTDDNPEDDE
jgi:hypothetical protein